jgi:hypothetical protein
MTDHLISLALGRSGQDPTLTPLDDRLEERAGAAALARLGVSGT